MIKNRVIPKRIIVALIILFAMSKSFAVQHFGGGFVKSTEHQMLMSTSNANKKILYKQANLTVELVYSSLMKESRFSKNQEDPYLVISNNFYKEYFSTSFSCQGYIKSARAYSLTNRYLILVDFQTNQSGSMGGFIHNQTGVFMYDRRGIFYIGSYTSEFQSTKEYSFGKGQIVGDQYFVAVEYSLSNNIEEFNTKVYDLYDKGKLAAGKLEINNYNLKNFKIEYADLIYKTEGSGIKIKKRADSKSETITRLSSDHRFIIDRDTNRILNPECEPDGIFFWVPIKTLYDEQNHFQPLTGWVRLNDITVAE